jgi:hypothetical protein
MLVVELEEEGPRCVGKLASKVLLWAAADAGDERAAASAAISATAMAAGVRLCLPCRKSPDVICMPDLLGATGRQPSRRLLGYQEC